MLRGIVDQFLLTLRLLRDPRVPIWSKAIPFAALLYVISPIDLIPDFIPGLGQLDDVGLVLAAMRLFESVSPEKVVREHRKMVERRAG